MIKVVGFTEDHARDILNRNAEDGIGISSGTSENEMIGAYMSTGSVACTFLKDDVPVFCGGIINLGWKRGEAWLLISKNFYKHRKTAFRSIMQMLPILAKSNGFRRVQAVTLDGEGEMLKIFGFEYEGFLRSYGPAGQDVFMHSRVFR